MWSPIFLCNSIDTRFSSFIFVSCTLSVFQQFESGRRNIFGQSWSLKWNFNLKFSEMWKSNLWAISLSSRSVSRFVLLHSVFWMATTPTIPCCRGSLWRRFPQMRWRWPLCQTLSLYLQPQYIKITYAHRHHVFMSVTAVHSHANIVSGFPAFALSRHLHLCRHISLFHSQTTVGDCYSVTCPQTSLAYCKKSYS